MTDINATVNLIVYAVLWVACGGLSGALAGVKGFDKTTWFMAGLFFGPVGLIAAAGLPDRRAK